MMIDLTILTGVLAWSGIQAAGGIIGNTAYAAIKDKGMFSSLKEKLLEYFNTEDEFETFIENVKTKKCSNPLKPLRDIEDTFEAVTMREYPPEINNVVTSWVNENKGQIEDVFSKLMQVNSSGMNIGNQNAKNIQNITNSSVIINQ